MGFTNFTKLLTTASDVCFLFVKYTINCYLYYLRSFNPSRPNPRQREKVKLNFHFHTKGFMKLLKAFIKLSEAPQRSVKIKIISIQLSEMHGTLRVKSQLWKQNGSITCILKYGPEKWTLICYLRIILLWTVIY